MKKIFSYIAATVISLSLAGCMDLEPTSSITDSNYWKNADQVQTFNQEVMPTDISSGASCAATSTQEQPSAVRLRRAMSASGTTLLKRAVP